MKLIVISDIHIFGPDDPLYTSLLELMRSETLPGDHLVLAGDIFDFFVGKPPAMIRKYSAFFSELRALGRREVAVTYIEGNHDFHLSETFSDMVHVEVVPAEKEIRVGDRRVYIAHGDLVDREDRGYLALRKFFRSGFARMAASALPERVVDWIGARSAEASRGANPRLPEERGLESRDRLRALYRGFAREKIREGFDAVVMGHCHDLDGEEFSESGRKGAYLNVGFPRKHHAYVVFADGKLERRPLRRFDN